MKDPVSGCGYRIRRSSSSSSSSGSSGSRERGFQSAEKGHRSIVNHIPAYDTDIWSHNKFCILEIFCLKMLCLKKKSRLSFICGMTRSRTAFLLSLFTGDAADNVLSWCLSETTIQGYVTRTVPPSAALLPATQR